MKTRSKGFTLIELLAVIVILAIIALIATPTILGVIEKARIGAAKSSALGYIDAVEKQVAINMLDTSKGNIVDGTYTTDELSTLGVSVKGTVPNGILTIKNNQVDSYIFDVNGYAVENGKATKPTNTKKYENGYAVYYNPITGKKCDDYVEANSKNETKTGCMKWYVFNDKEGSGIVNVILDHNTTARIKWNDDNKNVAYAESNLKAEIDALASEWKVQPRLIKAEEVNNITGKSGFDASNTSSWYYFDTKTQTKADFTSTRSKYDWLYNNLNKCKTDSTDYGCSIEDGNTYQGYGTAGEGQTWAYWTKTTYGSAGSGSFVWYVNRCGSLNYNGADKAVYGVRPVITISKSIVS